MQFQRSYLCVCNYIFELTQANTVRQFQELAEWVKKLILLKYNTEYNKIKQTTKIFVNLRF